MRLGSLIDGLAAARQGQAEERPKLDFARVQRVSPLRTLVVVAALVLTLRPATSEVVVGRLRWVPARIWLGSAIWGLAATSLGQRLPRPRFCCASFHSESPARTLMVRSVAIAPGASARLACSERSVVSGATGCTGLARTGGCNGADEAGGCNGWMRMPGGTGREYIFGCAGEIRRTAGRTSSRMVGRTSGRRISGLRTSGRTGTAEKGSRRKTFDGILNEGVLERRTG